ncbi:DUF2390 domain-containing protein [Marinobacter confluentis]|uniref:DUF2390 domain-containing protein n=1 Tax=Marinobacter confluentis TaxID=1697557 RepID=A0A4Z1BFP7_9GAMM|nr:DUF2390 domain-containing protein [Marinobacter confluentis]TGN38056.1 DUF2390 domain-containing protein [Marinobacter confluentis]
MKSDSESSELKIPPDLCLDSPLWHFAGRYWSRSGAQTAALALQTRGWSVTDILCGLWLALQGCHFSGTDSVAVTAWRSRVTEPLRQARKAISKNNPVTDRARNCIAQGELEAEKVELALAYRALNRDNRSSDSLSEHAVKTLALENLQAAAPEKAMDNETGSLLDTLTTELQIFAEEEQRTW